MAEFFQTFGFVVLPFLVLLSFSAVLPAVGSALYVRNEMMLAIALPPLSGAALTLGATIGLPPEGHTALFAFSFLVTFAAVSWLGSLIIPEIRRQIVLAALFAGAGALTHLLMSLSPHAHASLSFLLTGELLSLGPFELLQSVLLSTAGIVMFLKFRHAVYAYCIDEEIMRLRTVHFRLFSTAYRLMVTLLIAAAVLFVGPLLTSALLIFPALLADSGKSSITTFVAVGVAIGITGATGGFMAGVAMDIPPAYTGSLGILAMGVVLKAGAGLLPSLLETGRLRATRRGVSDSAAR